MAKVCRAIIIQYVLTMLYQPLPAVTPLCDCQLSIVYVCLQYMHPVLDMQ